MYVNLSHTTKRSGLVFKRSYYGVQLSVQLSEVEAQVVGDQQLEDLIVIQRYPPADIPDGHPDRFHLRLKHFTNGKSDTYFMGTISEAKDYEKFLVEALEDLKNVLTNSEEVIDQSRSFEL